MLVTLQKSQHTCRHIRWVHDIDVEADNNGVVTDTRFDLFRDPLDSKLIVVECVDQVEASRDIVIKILRSLRVSSKKRNWLLLTAMRVLMPAWIEELGLMSPCS